MPLGYVYKIINPEGKIYIGSTKDLNRRLKSYIFNKNKSQIKIFRSIQKYGFYAHDFTVICKCDISKMLQMERFLGDFYNCMDRDKGLNLKLPGYMSTPQIISEESKQKIRTTLTGSILPKSSRLKVSLNSKRISPSEHTKKMLREKKGRKIIQFDKSRNVVAEYFSTIEASELTKIKRSAIKECLNGRNKSCAGFIWEYADGASKSSATKKVVKMDFITNKILCTFNSITEAAKSVDLSFKSVSRAVRNKNYSAAGFKWALI